jgi:hypothetical protein
VRLTGSNNSLVLAQLTNALVNKTKIRIDIADMCDFDADFFFFFANYASKSLIPLCLVIERILSTNKNREYFYAIQKTEIQCIPALP